MFRIITLSALSLFLLIPADAFAQRRGGFAVGRGWNGNPGYGTRGYGSWNRGYNNWIQPGYGGYYGGYNGIGRFDGYNGGYYSNNVYPYGTSNVSGYAYPGTRFSSGYYDASADGTVSEQVNNSTLTANRARVEVLLPDDSAGLLIQGQRMNLTGRNRVFVSPDLPQGKIFTYTITMQRTTNGRNDDDTRRVSVQAGSKSTVDFSIPVSQQAPKPGFTDKEIFSPLPR